MSLSRIKRLFLTLLMVLSGVSSEISAAIRYKTDLLQRMAVGMQIESDLAALGEGVHLGLLKFNGKPLTVIVRDSVVEHIGYRVFREEMRTATPSPVYNFLERYSLELDVPYHREKPIFKQIEEDEIVFLKGSMGELCDMYDIPDVKISRYDVKSWSVVWQKRGKVVCEVHFKNHYDLLNGSTMEENERRLIEELKNHKIGDTSLPTVALEELTPTWKDNYFILAGESFYTDNVTSNKYYQRTEEAAFELLYNDFLPVESLANTFMTSAVDNEFTLNVKFRRYDLQNEYFSIPLNVWTDYCIKQGCQPFFGVIDQDEKKIDCLIIMKNDSMGYIHTLKVECPIDYIGQRQGHLLARMVSYIPISKILNLFDE